MTVPVYLGLLVFPQANPYREGIMATNVVFSYLWLAMFILSVTDWVAGSCEAFPVGQSCAQKKVVVALSFVGLYVPSAHFATETNSHSFFMFADTLLKGVVLYFESRSRRKSAHVEKEEEGPLTSRAADTDGATTNGASTNGVTTNGAATHGANGV